MPASDSSLGGIRDQGIQLMGHPQLPWAECRSSGWTRGDQTLSKNFTENEQKLIPPFHPVRELDLLAFYYGRILAQGYDLCFSDVELRRGPVLLEVTFLGGHPIRFPGELLHLCAVPGLPTGGRIGRK